MEPLFGVFPVPDAERQDAVVEQVLLADRLGLDLVGIQDHPYQRRHLDAWTLLSYLAGRTERVRLFPDVANLPLRHPALLAKSAATLDRLSGGRVELGLGAGAFWEGIGAWGGPVRIGAGVGRRADRGDRDHPPRLGRRARHQRRGRALPDARRPRRAAAGARHRDLARRLRAADDARGRAPRRRLDPVAAAAAARPGAPEAGRDRRGRAQGGPRPGGDPAGGEPQRRDRRRRRRLAARPGRRTGSRSS